MTRTSFQQGVRPPIFSFSENRQQAPGFRPLPPCGRQIPTCGKCQPQTLNPVLDLFASAASKTSKHQAGKPCGLGAVSSRSVVLGYSSHLLVGFKTSHVIKLMVTRKQVFMETVFSALFSIKLYGGSLKGAGWKDDCR